MSRTSFTNITLFLIGCGALVALLSVWLGPKDVAPEIPLTATSDTTETNDTTKTSDETNKPLVAPLNIDELAAYQTTMTNKTNPVAEFTTNMGNFSLELYEDAMPITAGNFIKLAESGFYNGIKFHRVIPGFMIQGGDPITKTDNVAAYGTGGPGYAIPDEHIAGEKLTNIRGTISMANSGPNSGGSQFFINVADNQNLDFDKEPLSSKHPVFGQVVSGMEVVDAIAQVKRNQRDLPLEPIVIESVKIVRE